MKKTFLMNENAVSLLREKNPLIHCITNYVTVNDCANALIAIGASPVMADEEAEVKDITQISNALLINIGTLNERTVNSMIHAGKHANSLNIPVLLDPVGAGASNYRTSTCEKLLDNIRFDIIRGNISEIKSLCKMDGKTRGVDAGESVEEGNIISINAAKLLKTVVAVTGKTDYISDGEKVLALNNGVYEISKISGTGCMLSAICGAFLGSGLSPLESAVWAVSSICIAGEIAHQKLSNKSHIYSLRTSLIDALCEMTDKDVIERLKIDEI